MVCLSGLFIAPLSVRVSVLCTRLGVHVFFELFMLIKLLSDCESARESCLLLAASPTHMITGGLVSVTDGGIYC